MNLVGKIFEERDWRKFEILSFNRNVKKITALKASMQKYGWINAFPMKVKQNGSGKFVIEDGHHRFEIAKELGIPFKFTICGDDATIFELDAGVHKWSLADFVLSYCRNNNQEYAFLSEFCDDTGIGINDAAAMMVGNSAGSSGHTKRFKQGKFEVLSMENANAVRSLVLHSKKKGVAWAHTHNLVLAFSKIAWVPEFSIARMKSKIAAFPHMMNKQPNLVMYLTMLDTLYNYKSTDKIPLKFLADQAARSRAAA